MTVLPKPIQRSAWRFRLGGLYFQTKRYVSWFKPGQRYTKTRFAPDHRAHAFPHVIVQHRTPLYRQLQNVDTWLQSNKVNNLTLAAACLDGVVLAPGETLSVWRLVGRPSRQKGYLPGMILVNGTMKIGTGGGLCQLSNLIYWMTLHTSLTVTERYRHQYDVFPDASRTLPFGSGATISYNYIDLQISNHTTRTYCLDLNLTNDHLMGQWLADTAEACNYEVFEQAHRITHHGGETFIRHNALWRRVVTAVGGDTYDEYITENHALMMYHPLLPAGHNA